MSSHLCLYPETISLRNIYQCWFDDNLIEQFLQSKELRLSASFSSPKIIEATDIFIIATPTDYDPKTNSFDTASVEEVIKEIFDHNHNQNSLIVIKSTVPVGFTHSIIEKITFFTIFNIFK